MIDEKEYIIRSFKKNFIEFKEKKIAIYGIGLNTKHIIDECKDYSIEVLLDKDKTGDILWDKEIVEYNTLKNRNIDIVIIVARYSNVKVIYKRIEKYCKLNNIRVFDINGNEQGSNNIQDNPFLLNRVNKKELIRLIDENECISFDIFDTLLSRKTLNPIEVFMIVQNRAEKIGLEKIDFAKKRRIVEAELNAFLVPNIDMIYNEIEKKYGIKKDILKRYKNLEFEIEKEVILPRREMVEIMEYAFLKDKKINLITDMYWKCSELTELLKKLNITQYEEIFISCEYSKTKANGLFEIYKENVKGESYLHIGDNYEIDYLMAIRNNINAFHIYSGKELFRLSGFSNLLENEENFNLESKYMIGLFVSKAFLNPFVFNNEKNKLVINSNKVFGFLFMGPLLTEFILWMTRLIEKDNNMILFTSRDGYILKLLFDIYMQKYPEKKYPSNIYLYTSRISSVVAGIKSIEDIEFVMKMPYSGTYESMLENRFFIKKEDILSYKKEEDPLKFILKHKDKIFVRSELERKNRKKYYDTLYLDNTKLYWIDFLSSGTGQYFLEKELNKKIKGIYFNRFITLEKEKNELDIESLYMSTNPFSDEKYLIKYYMFLERIMTSYEPTLKNFDEKGKMLFFSEKRTEEEINSILDVHEGIKEFFNSYINVMDKNCGKVDVPDELLGIMREECSEITASIGDRVILEDEFTNRTFEGMNMSWEG